MAALLCKRVRTRPVRGRERTVTCWRYGTCWRQGTCWRYGTREVVIFFNVIRAYAARCRDEFRVTVGCVRGSCSRVRTDFAGADVQRVAGPLPPEDDERASDDGEPKARPGRRGAAATAGAVERPPFPRRRVERVQVVGEACRRQRGRRGAGRACADESRESRKEMARLLLLSLTAVMPSPEYCTAGRWGESARFAIPDPNPWVQTADARSKRHEGAVPRQYAALRPCFAEFEPLHQIRRTRSASRRVTGCVAVRIAVGTRHATAHRVACHGAYHGS